MVHIIIFSIAILLFIVDILHELNMLRDIKSTFSCDNCGTLITEYRHNYKYKKCSRKVKIQSNSWEHLLLRKVNLLYANNRDVVIYYKDYTRLVKKEITVCITCICILTLGIIINL